MSDVAIILQVDTENIFFNHDIKQQKFAELMQKLEN